MIQHAWRPSQVTIDSDLLLPGQAIEYEANLDGMAALCRPIHFYAGPCKQELS
jgi:hypothetical protein